MTATLTWSVTYDTNGRITAFNNDDTAAFSYDANGNRVTSTQLRGATTTIRNYTVDPSSNKLLSYTQSINGGTTSTVTYSHNANGDLTEDGTRSFHYDPEQRLSTVNTGVTSTSPVTRYAHNALGERVFKTEPVLPNATDTLNLTAFYARAWNPATVVAERQGYKYAYGEDGTLLGEYGTGGSQSTGNQQFIWLPTPQGPMPIAAIVNSAKFGIYADHLNTPRRMINATGGAVWQWGFSAFGEEPATTARFRFGDLEKNPNPGTTSVADITLNLRYPGQYYDKESKLHYNYHRSYKPDNGRYTQADPIGLDGGWNRFVYASSAPLEFADPMGLYSAWQSQLPVIPPIEQGSAPLGAACVSSSGALSPNIMQLTANKQDGFVKRQQYCLSFCQFELQFPGRRDNFGPHRACMRRCMADGGFVI